MWSSYTLVAGVPSKAAKELRTFRTQCLHFFNFCLDVNLDDDSCLSRCSIERCNWQLALYAVYLATGIAVIYRSIKPGIIVKKYLRNVAKFYARDSPDDPRKLDETQKPLTLSIQGIIKEVQLWENILNWREPFIIEMLHYLQHLFESQLHVY